jgi:putative membrane protein
VGVALAEVVSDDSRTESSLIQRLLFRWAFNVVALFVAAWVLSGVGYGNDWWTLFLAAVVFTVVNMIVKPALTLLSIPFIVVTLGFAYLLINVLMLYITDWLVKDFRIENFGSALVAALIVSFVNLILHAAFGRPDKRKRR